MTTRHRTTFSTFCGTSALAGSRASRHVGRTCLAFRTVGATLLVSLSILVKDAALLQKVRWLRSHSEADTQSVARWPGSLHVASRLRGDMRGQHPPVAPALLPTDPSLPLGMGWSLQPHSPPFWILLVSGNSFWVSAVTPVTGQICHGDDNMYSTLKALELYKHTCRPCRSHPHRVSHPWARNELLPGCRAISQLRLGNAVAMGQEGDMGVMSTPWTPCHMDRAW